MLQNYGGLHEDNITTLTLQSHRKRKTEIDYMQVFTAIYRINILLLY